MSRILGLRVVGLLCMISMAFADVPCSKCLTEGDYSGCANQDCQNVEGKCEAERVPDPEDPESEVIVYVDTFSYKLVHLSDPKFCGAINSNAAPDGTDCVGVKEYVCYKKVSSAGLGCSGGSCEEFATVRGCSVSVEHHNCLFIPPGP